MRNKFIKYFFFISIIIVTITTNAKAKSGYLYDIFKEEKEANGLAMEYNGEHKDSFSEEPSYKIYRWKDNIIASEIELIKNSKWNVIFGGFCWQMLRTTDTGGVKMIYNGIPNEGKCNNSGVAQEIGKTPFNSSSNSLAYIGYMYNPDTLVSYPGSASPSSGALFGANVNYNNGVYQLRGTSTSYNSTHHYTCNNTSGECTSVRYYYYNNYYINLTDGKKVEDAISDMLNSDDVNKTDSTIKNYIENWYANNLIDYTDFIENTIFCNSRAIYSLGGWKPNGGEKMEYLLFRDYGQYGNTLACRNETDQFSTDNPKARLKYPIGLVSYYELNNVRNYTGEYYWIGSPASSDTNTVQGAIVTNNGSRGYRVDNSAGVRPAISLVSGIKYISGEGSIENPYIVKDYSTYTIDVEIKNETDNVSVNIDDMSLVKNNEEVIFKITPTRGYKINSIHIIDSENNEIECFETENNNEYKFTMPASDVTIIPSYEKVSNSIAVEDNKNTKEIIIEVNDTNVVVYEHTVKFKLVPEDGYEVEDIEIIDNNNNKIEYTKTNKENEYSFSMPDTDVVIKPLYRKIETNKPETLTNPKTGNKTIIIFLLIIVCAITMFFRKKERV